MIHHIVSYVFMGLYFWLVWRVRKESNAVKKECLEVMKDNRQLIKFAIAYAMDDCIRKEDYKGAMECKRVLDGLDELS